MTCRRDHLPSNIPPQYFHKLNTDSKQQAKEARILHPVVDVKDTHAKDEKQAYQRAHISFKYTSSCKISTVNFLAQSKLKIDLKYMNADTTSVSGVSK